MNSFRQHIPGFARDGREPPEPVIPFETTADLLALEIVQRYKGPTFSHFAMSENHLMAISDDGYSWWVVGFVADPSAVDLPQWDGGKHLARLADGVEVTLTRDTTPHVSSSCGGRLSLSDGTEAVDVRFERDMAKQRADNEKDDRGICPKCDVAYTHTEGPSTLKSRANRDLIELRDVCPNCGRSKTWWRKGPDPTAVTPVVVQLGRD